MPSESRRLLPTDQRALERLRTDPASPPRQALRAEMVLLSGDGISDRQIAARVGVSPPTVSLWRRRYQERGVDGLRDDSRPGRPPAVRSRLGHGPGATSEDTLNALLRAARRMIVRRGFAATRVADIAAEVGVAPATVHYHFDRKDEILVRALLWTNEQLIADLEASESTEDPVRRLARFIERTIPHPGERRDEYLLEIDLWSWMRIHGEELETYGAYGDRWIEHIRQIIQDGVDVGAFTVVTSAGEVAERLVALTDGLAVQSAIGLSRMPAARVGQMIRRFATEQLGLRDGALH